MTSKNVFLVLAVFLFAQMVSAEVVVDSVSIEPSYIEPGNDVDVTVKFHEALVARELYSSPPGGAGKSPASGDKNAFYMVKLAPNDGISSDFIVIKEGEKNIGRLFKGESWSTPFKFKVKEGAPATSYTLEFRVYETDENYGSTRLSRTYSFNITVNGVVQFTLLSGEQDAKAGEKSDLKFQLANVGKGNARHVSVLVNTSSPMTVLGASEVYVGDIADESPRDLSFGIYVDSTASPKAYVLPVTISYIDRSGAKQAASKTIGVKVMGSPKIETSLDKQDDLKAGMTGKVSISVANKAFIDAKFLSIQLLDTGDYTVTSKSEAYIGNLASDDFQTEEFAIKVADGAKAGKIPLKAKVTYTEENNNVVHVEEPAVLVNVMSEQDYARKYPQGNGTQSLVTLLLVVPALVVAYLALWLLLKIVGLITTFIDKRVFKK